MLHKLEVTEVFKKLLIEVLLPSAGRFVYMLPRIWFGAKKKKKSIIRKNSNLVFISPVMLDSVLRT